MNKATLIQAYHHARGQMDFVPNEREPWLAKLGEKDGKPEYRELQKEGNTKADQPVRMQVIDSAYFPEIEREEQLALFDRYQQLQTLDSIQLPKIFDRMTSQSYTAILWERLTGQYPIALSEMVTGRCQDQSVTEKIEKIAAAYWATVEVLKTLATHAPSSVQARLAGVTTRKYLNERFHKWDREAEQYGLAYAELMGEREKREVQARVFGNFPLEEVPMELFWNLFGNTGMTEKPDGQIYLNEGRFEIKPAGFGVAAFLWNLTLHGWKRSGPELHREVIHCIKLFQPAKPDSSFSNVRIQVNLAERFYAVINVDLQCRRLPFHQIGQPGQSTEEDFQQTVENHRFLLNSNLLR